MELWNRRILTGVLIGAWVASMIIAYAKDASTPTADNVCYVYGTQTNAAPIVQPDTGLVISDRATLQCQVTRRKSDGFLGGKFSYNDSSGKTYSGGLKQLNSSSPTGFKATFAALVQSFNDRFIVTVTTGISTPSGVQDMVKMELVRFNGVSYPGFPRTGYFDAAESVKMGQ